MWSSWCNDWSTHKSDGTIWCPSWPHRTSSLGQSCQAASQWRILENSWWSVRQASWRKQTRPLGFAFANSAHWPSFPGWSPSNLVRWSCNRRQHCPTSCLAHWIRSQAVNSTSDNYAIWKNSDCFCQSTYPGNACLWTERCACQN